MKRRIITSIAIIACGVGVGLVPAVAANAKSPHTTTTTTTTTTVPQSDVVRMSCRATFVRVARPGVTVRWRALGISPNVYATVQVAEGGSAMFFAPGAHSSIVVNLQTADGGIYYARRIACS